MKQLISGLVLGLAFTLAGVAVAKPTLSINSDVVVAAGQKTGDVSTVNGDIRVGEDATVRKAETVNGDVTLGARASARSLHTVNGDVTLKAGANVADGVETVNGDVTLQQGADVRGGASNVNGTIRLDAAHVGDGLETVDGDITVGAKSRVDGGITVHKPGRGWRNNDGRNHVPRIVIGPHAVVTGKLVFEREVKLYVSDSAQIGPVTGATVQTFSGDHP